MVDVHHVSQSETAVYGDATIVLAGVLAVDSLVRTTGCTCRCNDSGLGRRPRAVGPGGLRLDPNDPVRTEVAPCRHQQHATAPQPDLPNPGSRRSLLTAEAPVMLKRGSTRRRPATGGLRATSSPQMMRGVEGGPKKAERRQRWLLRGRTRR